jgi:prepilin-type processing-associated H-X9-DG protein
MLGWTALSSVRGSHVSSCVENLRSIGAAVSIYAADSDGRIPYYPRTGQGLTSRPGSFFESLEAYGVESEEAWCPLDKHAGTQFSGFLHDFVDSSYAISPSLASNSDMLPDGVGVKLSEIESPQDQALIADNLWTVKIAGRSEWMTSHGRNSGNVLWADGRVERDYEFND